MKKDFNKFKLLLLLVSFGVCLTGCTQTSITKLKITEKKMFSNEVTEEEIVNQKLKSIPEEDQINVLDNNLISQKDVKQRVVEVYIPNYEENYLIAKTISLEVEEGTSSDYVNTDKVMNFLREKEIIPSHLPDISIGKQISENSTCLNVNYPKEVYDLFDNKEDEKIFLDATLKSLLNIYDVDQVSISVDYATYKSNFIEITEHKYYK